MKQRQRSGLVTPQQNNGSALPLPSPQPGSSMQQQQQLPGGITPNHHHRTLSQSSSIHPPIPQPPQQPNKQQQQQQQQQQSQTQVAGGIFAMVQGWTNDHLEKATASMLSKVVTTNNVSVPLLYAMLQLTLIAVPSAAGQDYVDANGSRVQEAVDGSSQTSRGRPRKSVCLLHNGHRLTVRFPGNVGQLMSLDHASLQNVVWNQLKTTSARQMQVQQQAAMQQSQNRQMQNQMGSQSNPVDITTPQIQPTVPINNNVPSFAQQPSGNFAPPPPPQRQPSSSGPGSGQTNPNQQWQQQQQQQQAPPQPQVLQSVNRGKAWAGHDFSKTHFPIPEEKFLPYILQMLNITNFQPPAIQNRVVDLYALFNLVHKNGGSVKVSLIYGM
jgi:hypothetical protein